MSYKSGRRGSFLNNYDLPTTPAVKQPMGQGQSKGPGVPMIDSPISGIPRRKLSKVKLNITRETNTILERLPFATWCPTAIPDNYQSIFERCNVMPAGATVSVTYDTDDLLITWTKGGNTDIIRIHCTGLVPYSQRLNMILADGQFSSTGFRYRTKSGTEDLQFEEFDYFTFENGFTSIALEDSDDIISLIGPDQYLPYIADVVTPIWINPERGEVHGFPNYGAGASPKQISWTYFDVKYMSTSDKSRMMLS